ncbi:MAG: DNA replication and repair protein RecF [Acidimicrobiaceae bacterium]|nr:DNA replication and repair protein RecF [Acidimicrobiaceae bacterium]
MGLHELTLRNFRSFKEFVFQPDRDAVTVLLSPNGTGKTSILEAVYAIATASSFRTTSASDMIRAHHDLAEVHGVLFQRERRVQVDLTLHRGLRNTTKRMLVNGQRPQSRAAVAEVLPLTVFTPEGVDVVRQGPDQRRTLISNLLTDVWPHTGEIIERYAKVLQQRNAFLRGLQGIKPSLRQREELLVWDAEFCLAAEELIGERQHLLQRLSPLITHFYQELAHDNLAISAEYEKSWVGNLDQALWAVLPDDVQRGYSTIGPHRDDVILQLDTRDARRQASQGEQRSLALSIRLAGHELVQQERIVAPLLLLDDVFSELDPVRSDRLLRLLPGGQTLVTTASPLPKAMTPAVIIDLTVEI